MPSLAPRLCTCGQVHCGPCPRAIHRHAQHQAINDRRRGTSSNRGYGADWRKIRARVLAEEPLCMCPDHQGRDDSPASDTVDHILPKARGGTDARDNLQGIHHDCHSRKTAKEDGGFGNPEKPDLQTIKHSRIPVTIVSGAPGSGKSTWVRQHAQPADLVVDLDEIRSRLSGKPIYCSGTEWLGPAMDERDRLLLSLATTTTHTKAWFIVSAPEARVRGWWVRLLGPLASTVVLETPAAECQQRVITDPRRSLTAETSAAIQRWWSFYSKWERDQIVRQYGSEAKSLQGKGI